MKLSSLGLALCLLCGSAAQASAIYDYAYTFGNGAVVTGSFTGDRAGNLISGLSDITVVANGHALNGSGSLFASSWTLATGWRTGGGVVSLDGTANNFLFIDSNYPADSSFTNYFYSIQAPEVSQAMIYSAYANATDSPAVIASFSVTERAAVPEPGSLALLGLGLAGAATALRRRSRAA